ncbi:MAG: pilus assembly protein [Gemmataceae bacterium]|nr:pilus assembly protein [Gemmataceae bacterium]
MPAMLRRPVAPVPAPKADPMILRTPRRPAVAAVEFAFIAPVLVVILAGVWEVGRMVEMQQLLSNAAREGSRLAAQGLTINSSGDPTQIQVSTGDPNVKQTVLNYLNQAGLPVTWSNLTVTFQYLDGDTTKTQPWQATKSQRFRVTATIQTSGLGWSFLNIFTPTAMTATAEWYSVVNDPFTLDTTIPSW